jgi:XapX domain-containing protein
MKNIVISLLCGMFVGSLFAFVKLPSPAPQKLEGIVGIIGIFLGYFLVDYFKNRHKL